MKKRICLTVMAFVMVLSLTACAEQNSQTSTSEEVVASTSVEEKEDVIASEEAPEASEEAPEASEEAPEASEEVPEASVEEMPEEASVPEKDFAVGSIENNVYENTYAGLGCALSEDWIILDQEQMLAYNQLAAENAGEEYAKLVETLQTAYEMLAINQTNLSTIIIAFEKLGTFNFLLTEEEYLDTVMNQDFITEGLINGEIGNIEVSKGTITLGGQERKCLNIFGNSAGVVDMYEVIIPIKLSKHFYLMSIATYGENNTQSVANLFYAIEE